MSELTAIRGSLGRLRMWVRATREDGLGPMGTDLATLSDIVDVLEADISELEDDLNTAELDNEYLREQLRHIEQLERDSAYMRLPVDADGVPIRPGDRVDVINGTPCTFNVEKMWLNRYGWAVHGRRPDEFRHVQQDAVESLMKEFALACEEQGYKDPRIDGIVEDYAERIRKAVEHD